MLGLSSSQFDPTADIGQHLMFP